MVYIVIAGVYCLVADYALGHGPCRVGSHKVTNYIFLSDSRPVCSGLVFAVFRSFAKRYDSLILAIFTDGRLALYCNSMPLVRIGCRAVTHQLIRTYVCYAVSITVSGATVRKGVINGL